MSKDQTDKPKSKRQEKMKQTSDGLLSALDKLEQAITRKKARESRGARKTTTKAKTRKAARRSSGGTRTNAGRGRSKR